tara:strand:+ start:694 stop:864 length:171 start_codon:yes stop_codon:yes gene_type:complete
MTKKDLKLIEMIVKKAMSELLDIGYEQDKEDVIVSISVLEKIEAYMGEPVRFMAIS